MFANSKKVTSTCTSVTFPMLSTTLENIISNAPAMLSTWQRVIDSYATMIRDFLESPSSNVSLFSYAPSFFNSHQDNTTTHLFYFLLRRSVNAYYRAQ